MSRRYTIYAVDFDGTLCESVYPGIGRPNFALIHHLKKKKAKGNILILWTCRCGESLQAAVDWCKDYGLEFDYINENVPEMINEHGNDCRKIFADVYIDDKAVNKPRWNVPFKDYSSKKMTNIEHIKSMGFMELANFIKYVHHDGAYVESGYHIGRDTVDMFGNKGVNEWLRSEVKDDR